MLLWRMPPFYFFYLFTFKRQQSFLHEMVQRGRCTSYRYLCRRILHSSFFILHFYGVCPLFTFFTFLPLRDNSLSCMRWYSEGAVPPTDTFAVGFFTLRSSFFTFMAYAPFLPFYFFTFLLLLSLLVIYSK